MARRTPEQAIRAFCLECSNHSKKEVELCAMNKCPLYPYRLKPNQEPSVYKDESAPENKEKEPETLTLFD